MPRAPSDVWIHFTSAIVEGKAVYMCIYCAKTYVNKNATKMQQHIAKCPKFPSGSKQATPVVAQPARKKAKKHFISDSVRDQDPLHVQNQREYEERLRREAREEQKEEQASLMTMWKEMMEFQGNLLREFIHRPSLPTSLPSHSSYYRHAHHNQGHSTFPSTSYMTLYASPGAETENESAISQEEDEEEEEEKYVIPAEIAPVLDAQPVNSANDSQSNTAETVSPPPTQSAGKKDLEMSVLRRQERVLELQEEYYSLKIKYLKDKMAKDSGQNNKEEC
ncbi:hypothetical protein ABG768_024424 [Culter alburnus]|uniref:BED-type domain-containing protein n=1 Tax=Culter alburnus TaxID=194366 RepID=A0AAW2AKV8_CULAL